MRKQRGFTLVELLVVVGIIAILIAMLLPALQRVQRQSRAAVCLSNQRQLIMAVIMYANDNGGVFPGGSGFFPWKDDSGAPRPPFNTVWGASYDFNAFNPYSCNADPEAGPTYLAKYVSKSEKIPACPAEQELKRIGSFAPNNFWTGYWYPMSIVFNPVEIWDGSAASGSVKQTPQKLVKVKYPTQKVIIIDRKTFHSKTIVDTDKAPAAGGSLVNGTNVPSSKQLLVAAGFADGHADLRSTYEMFDTDVNWTGRPTPGSRTKADVAGVRGRDFR